MSADPFYYGDDDECDCPMCDLTRQLAAMITPRETVNDGRVIEGIGTIAYTIANGGILTFTDTLDLSNSGDLDDSYKSKS